MICSIWDKISTAFDRFDFDQNLDPKLKKYYVKCCFIDSIPYLWLIIYAQTNRVLITSLERSSEMALRTHI